jgi:sugar diacid utilization regulator
VQLLAVEDGELTETERRLVQLVIHASRSQDKNRVGSAPADEERRAQLVHDWFVGQLELGHSNAEMPDFLASQLSLYTTKIPMLLYGEYSDNRKVQHRELKKLLESFFEADMLVIPLMEKEWLILGSESLLAASRSDRESGEDESLEEALTSICYGLHEMLSNEWVGECHLSIHYPIMPAKSLFNSVIQLRETMMLGRTFHVASNIHLPWLLHLERLLNSIPDSEKSRFTKHVFKRFDLTMDTETQATLEHFFELDCNVSETAKKLYIHRNTLLYRLDRFKQETGLDVRNFSDAVLVKIALLLYKVTKRK